MPSHEEDGGDKIKREPIREIRVFYRVEIFCRSKMHLARTTKDEELYCHCVSAEKTSKYFTTS